MVLETYEAFTAYLEALPANVDRLDAAAKAVSAAAQLPALHAWLIRLLFVLAATYGVHFLLSALTIIPLSLYGSFWLYRIHDGIVVTNARLIIACLSAACCAVCLADCVDQIQIHYGRASYRHAYLIHELKWPILYLIAWDYVHSVLCHLQRTGRLLSFAAQDLPQREAKKLRIKVAVLNASLVGVSVVVPAVQLPLAFAGGYHLDRAIVAAGKLVPELQAQSATIPSDAPFSSIEVIVRPAQLVFSEVNRTTWLRRISNINWSVFIALTVIIFFPAFVRHLEQLRFLMEVNPRSSPGSLAVGDQCPPSKPSTASLGLLRGTSTADGFSGQRPISVPSSSHLGRPSEASLLTGSASAPALSKRIRYESLLLIVIVASGYGLCSLLFPLAVWGAIVPLHSSGLWNATYWYGSTIFALAFTIAATLFCYVHAFNLWREHWGRNNPGGRKNLFDTESLASASSSPPEAPTIRISMASKGGNEATGMTEGKRVYEMKAPRVSWIDELTGGAGHSEGSGSGKSDTDLEH